MNLSDKQILKNAFPDWVTGGGVFANMPEMPWSDEVDGLILDVEYFGNRSGLKFCSPLIYNFLDDTGVVSEDGRTTIIRVLTTRYKKQWQNLWNTYTAQYDPLLNYDITENVKRDLEGSDSDKTVVDQTREGTQEITDTRNLTQKHTGTDTIQESPGAVTDETVNNNYNGFNSQAVAGVPVSNQSRKTTQSGSNTQTETPDLTDTDTGTVNRESSDSDTLKGTTNRTGSNNEDETINRTKSGFIGSRQKIISEERELWMWDYFDQVFRDTDRMLSLAIFDPCKVELLYKKVT